MARTPLVVAVVFAGLAVWFGTQAVAGARELNVWRGRYQVEHARYLAERAHRLRTRDAYGLEHAHVRRLLRERVIVRTAQSHDPSVSEALELAATVYGNRETLWRRARCETGGTFSPRAYNPSSGASGLLQFLPSTWASTPFARFSVWSPYANALAAGWMMSVGRGNEWSCR